MNAEMVYIEETERNYVITFVRFARLKSGRPSFSRCEPVAKAILSKKRSPLRELIKARLEKLPDYVNKNGFITSDLCNLNELWDMLQESGDLRILPPIK